MLCTAARLRQRVWVPSGRCLAGGQTGALQTAAFLGGTGQTGPASGRHPRHCYLAAGDAQQLLYADYSDISVAGIVRGLKTRRR